MKSAVRRSAPVRSAAIRQAPRRSAPLRSAPRSRAPIRSAPLRFFFLRPVGPAPAPARTSSLVRRRRTLTSARCAATSRSASASGVPWVRASVASRRRRSSGWRGRAGSRVSASVKYQSSSWSWRTTGNVSNICWAVSGACRQSWPPKVTCETCWPAPKQSYTVQPGKPWSRSRVWIPQRKSVRRWVQGRPARLSAAKSADAAKGSATQHSPKQFAQSPCRVSCRGGDGGWGTGTGPPGCGRAGPVAPGCPW